MTLSAIGLFLALYFALGVRIGWTGRVLVLLVASAVACVVAFLFVSVHDNRFFIHYLGAAAASDVAIQFGFVVGLLTAARTRAPASHASAEAAALDPDWIQRALNRLDDRGLPVNVFSRLAAFANRPGNHGRKSD